MIVIRRGKHTQNYVVIPDGLARDPRISLRAHGLLVWLLSLPPDQELNLTTDDDIAGKVPDSRDSIRAAMRELRAAGYVVLHTERSRRGRMTRWLEVFDVPQPPSPNAVTDRAGNDDPSQVTASPVDGKPPRSVRPAETAFAQVAPNAGFPAPGNPADKDLEYTETSTSSRSTSRNSGDARLPRTPSASLAQKQASDGRYEDEDLSPTRSPDGSGIPHAGEGLPYGRSLQEVGAEIRELKERLGLSNEKIARITGLGGSTGAATVGRALRGGGRSGEQILPALRAYAATVQAEAAVVVPVLVPCWAANRAPYGTTVHWAAQGAARTLCGGAQAGKVRPAAEVTCGKCLNRRDQLAADDGDQAARARLADRRGRQRRKEDQ